MQLGVLPWNKRAIHPDEPVAQVERQDRHRKAPCKRLEWNFRRPEKSPKTPFSLSFAAKAEKPPKDRKLVFARRVGLDD
jgi:hypothetical protein